MTIAVILFIQLVFFVLGTKKLPDFNLIDLNLTIYRTFGYKQILQSIVSRICYKLRLENKSNYSKFDTALC